MTKKTSQKDPKVILRMKMPENCGKCKFGMKTCNGKDFCFITRDIIHVDCKAATCPLEEYEKPATKRKPMPKKLPCKSCGCKKIAECVMSTGGKFFQCTKCEKDSSGVLSNTWRAAIEVWNQFNQ